ncbi:MAG: hypothetical protein M1548_06090 [Actinobacteria bacterium]|nr:hypothetical protein [Actinomycetota bacterium]
MDRFLFLKEWERLSKITLSEQGRVNFLQECREFMHYGESILMNALKIAKKNNKFDLNYLKMVAAKLYERECHPTPTDPPIDSGSSYSLSFSGLSSSLLNLGGGDYYEHRERRRRRF